MKTTNKHVAVEVFKRDNTEKEQSRGMVMPDRLTDKLLSTKVLFDSDSYSVGDTLYFKSGIAKLPEALNKLEFDGVIFIVLPESHVVAYDKASKDLPFRGD